MGAFQLKKMPGNTKIEMDEETNITREYHNQKDCSRVLQTNVHRECQKQKDCQRL